MTSHAINDEKISLYLIIILVIESWVNEHLKSGILYFGGSSTDE